MIATATTRRQAAELAFEEAGKPVPSALWDELQAAGKAEMDEYLAGFDARNSQPQAGQDSPRTQAVKISSRYNQEAYRMRNSSTYKGDLVTAYSRRINGRAYDFSRVVWADGTVTLSAYEGNTTNVIHQWVIMPAGK